MTRLEKQPADGRYSYASGDDDPCVIHRYLASIGERTLNNPLYFTLQGALDSDGERPGCIFIALDQPHTFGGALKRAREVAAILREQGLL